MGFVKRSIEVEEYLDSIGVVWCQLKDAEYRLVISELNTLSQSQNCIQLHGDEAFNSIERKTPINGFLFNAPGHKLFSVYDSATGIASYGYSVNNLASLNREALNKIECVVTNKSLSFACSFNHEWQAMCPEVYIEKSV